MPRALIAEDEPLLRAQLKARLADAWPELDIIGDAETGEQALVLIEELKPDAERTHLLLGDMYRQRKRRKV